MPGAFRGEGVKPDVLAKGSTHCQYLCEEGSIE